MKKKKAVRDLTVIETDKLGIQTIIMKKMCESEKHNLSCRHKCDNSLNEW